MFSLGGFPRAIYQLPFVNLLTVNMLFAIYKIDRYGAWH
jgi:hypothetical protein